MPWVIQRISPEDSAIQTEEIPKYVEYVQVDRETQPPEPDIHRIAARDQRANQSVRVIIEVLESAGTPSQDAGANRVTDPVVEFRQALGWGPLDRTALSRTAAPSQDAQGFAAATPPSKASLARSWKPAVNVRGTALGQYIEQVEQIVSQRWQDSDLEADHRAIGIQGQVTLEYTVRRDGRVVVVQVAASSGVQALDDMARAALPRKLPRFPPELAQSQLHHRLVLRYQNPLVGATKPSFR
ncbi:MAG: TonB family protein [Rhodobacterales bacterium]|nr:TonB family protein [Rhodobacterales bacterium]